MDSCRNVDVTRIVPTALRESPLYYQLYCVILNSLVVSTPSIVLVGHAQIFDIQGSAKRLRPGCVNAAGKLRQEW